MSAVYLTPGQQRDLLRGFADHERFCRESLRLRDRSGSLLPLTSWPSQIKLTAAIRKQQKRGHPVRIIVLKTRRSGFTVGSCSHVFKEIAPLVGRKGFVIADKYRPAALEAFDYLKSFANNYQPFGGLITIPPLHISDSDMQFTRGDDLVLEVYSADRGEIRGGGRHWALFDEVAFWRAPELTLRSAVNMIPSLAETGIIIQSTANGVGGEFYERCKRAQDPALKEGWEFLFFGWLEDLNNSKPFESREDMVRLQASLDAEEYELHTRHHANLEQLNWRRWKIGEAFAGRVDDFHQEYPTTPEEAFLTSGRPALDHKALARMPVSAGTSGELQVIEEFPRRKIRFIAREHGAITMWRNPQVGHLYIAGADPSKGVDVSEAQRGSDPDWAVGFVIDQGVGDQVAMLRARLRPAAFAEYLALLCEVFNWAFLVPEANDAGFIDALLRTNYPIGRVYNRRRDPGDLRSGQPGEIGFETTNVTRPWLISALDDAIREMAITIRSPIALQECRTFVIKPNGKAEHQQGCHDDTVIAAALAAIGLRYAPKKNMVAPGQPLIATTYGKPKRIDDDD